MYVLFKIFAVLTLVFLLNGCAEKMLTVNLTDESTTKGHFVSFGDLKGWQNEDHTEALRLLNAACLSGRLPPSLSQLCSLSQDTANAREFFETHFHPFMLASETGDERLLTGYYEPQFQGSLQPGPNYPYPLYKRPKDIVNIELASVYTDLENRRFYGRLEGKRVVPYYSRHEINEGRLNEKPLCYLKSDIDRFFLQVQGSGRIILENNETIFVGYDGQNGHPYRSIGKALVESGAIAQDEISLQSIRLWLNNHPDDTKKVLESNPSFVFFDKRTKAASGAMGIELTAMRSVAVDKSKIPLGYPLFLSAVNPLNGSELDRIVYAQDTGGAIKGQVRADLFCGSGKKAEALAGGLRSPLQLYLLIPDKMTELISKSSSLR